MIAALKEKQPQECTSTSGAGESLPESPNSGHASCQFRAKAGNAPVAPLVLHEVVGGGNHLPSGDPNARLPYPFP